MKTRLIVLLLCLPFMAFCQFSSSLDVVLGLEKSDPTSDDYLNIRDSNDIDSIPLSNTLIKTKAFRYTLRLGVNFNKRLSNKFYFKTGARFTHLRHKEESPKLDRNTQTYNLEDIRVTKYNYTFIEAPINGRFQFTNNKWSPFIELGVSPMLLIAKNENFAHRKLHFSGNLSVGMNYTYQEEFQFFAQPILRYHFTELNNSLSYGLRFISYGIEFGVRRKI